MKIKPCKMCGKEFMLQQRAQKYCCAECSRAADKAARKRIWEKLKEERRKYTGGITRPAESISEINRLAREQGLTYGQYMAQRCS